MTKIFPILLETLCQQSLHMHPDMILLYLAVLFTPKVFLQTSHRLIHLYVDCTIRVYRVYLYSGTYVIWTPWDQPKVS